MKTVIKIINFIRLKFSLQHREFKSLLEDTGAQFDDLLLHNNVRWFYLTDGFVLQRFFFVATRYKRFFINV